MNLKEIREIISLMNENDLSEIELEREGTKIKISKGSGGFQVSSPRQSVQYVDSPAVVSHAQAPKADASSDSHLQQIVSPMVGTFYRSPSPESPSFIEVGQVVEIGQVVCIVEAMKLMNEIKSEVRGKVVSVEIENAQPIEYGQILFKVEPV